MGDIRQRRIKVVLELIFVSLVIERRDTDDAIFAILCQNFTVKRYFAERALRKLSFVFSMILVELTKKRKLR